MRLGHLPSEGLETGALRSDNELRKGIRRFQTWARINATGEYDSATKNKMLAPR